jgi:hypothetical protein
MRHIRSLIAAHPDVVAEPTDGLDGPISERRYRWLSVPRWYLWDGGFLLIARADGVVPAHAHHAIQIVIALDGRMAICGRDGTWRELESPLVVEIR